MDRIRTIVFGGSFDPVHIGHLSLAREVLRCGLAGEVWFMVSPRNPLKMDVNLTDEQLRYEMVQLALENETGMRASDFEFHLPRPSYTLNTLNKLSEAFPDREFTLLVGADNWEKFDLWYKGDEIVGKYGLVVYPRDKEDVPQLPDGVRWLDAQLHDISSTQVRSMVANGEDISPFVPQKVVDFIKDNRLYI
jgi:nicotinate-nucleotide adenylyltransferase